MFFQISSDILRKSLIQVKHYSISSKLTQKNNHYEVLNLPRDCSTKDIRNAFIKLSKKHHPDIDKSQLAHAKFLKINQAYNILSNPDTRRSYDLGLIEPDGDPIVRSGPYRTVYQDIRNNPWKDTSFYENRDKSQDKYYEQKPYYGIKGIPRVSNGIIVLMCLLFASFGVSLQFLAIHKSFTFERDKLLRRSMEIQEELNSVRETAEKNGNELQLKLLEIRANEFQKKTFGKKDL